MDFQRIDQAISLRDAGEWDAALLEFRDLERFSDCEEEKGELFINQVWCLSGLKRLPEARARLQDAANLQIESLDYRARIDLLDASLDSEEGKAEESLKKLDRLLKKYASFLQTQTPRYVYEEAQMRRGCLLAYLERFKEACPILEAVLHYGIVKHADFFFHLGNCYLRLGKKADAEKMLSKALSLGLEGGWAVAGHYYLGSCYLESGAYVKAMQEFEAAESLASKFNKPKKHLYEALIKTAKVLGLDSEAAKYDHLLRNARS